MTKKTKVKLYTALLFVVLFIGLAFLFLSGDTLSVLKNVFRDDITTEQAQDELTKLGWRGYVTFGALSMLQVVFTFLPAEPAQVVSGISFGFWWGSLICLCGVVVGNTIMYILDKIFGEKLTEYFQTNAEFDFDVARKSNKIAVIIFILYFLPAIPYGLICLFAASLDMKYPRYIIVTTLGSVPSIFIGVGLGHMAMSLSWILSIIVFAVLVILLLILFKYRSKVFAKINAFMNKKENQSAAHDVSGALLGTLAFGSKLLYDGKIKPKFKNNVGKLERPSIVLCNHGSFIDFVYAGRILRKEKPHFVTARLYTYHKKLGKIMKKVGCIPKSMFSADLENAKGCMRVLGHEGVLVLLPEARLSTVGRFEDIQPSTYKFLQRSNVPIYVINLRGDYLANPKWGDGARKGGVVEVELNRLLSAQEVAELSLEELQTKIEAALDYDEFAWLESKPELKYRKKTLAEGLQNILYICPNCGGRYALNTKNHEIFCEKCGEKWSIDDRYAFVDKKPFENFTDWYAWQVEETKKEIINSEDYRLESKVELRHGSKDGKSFTRHAGEGVCTLTKEGLRYCGSEDGQEIEKFFPLSQIYRLLFGAGENFEIYEGKEIWYFRPEEKRSCVTWYVVSALLKELYDNK